jgi:hypothetical protein
LCLCLGGKKVPALYTLKYKFMSIYEVHAVRAEPYL